LEKWYSLKAEKLKLPDTARMKKREYMAFLVKKLKYCGKFRELCVYKNNKKS